MTSQVNHMHAIARFFRRRADSGTLVRIRLFRRSSHLAPAALAVVLFVAVAYVDCWVIGPAVSASLLYVLAVLAVTWVGSWYHGVLLAVLAALESIFGHVLVHPVPAAITLPTVWNSLTRLLVLTMVALLLGSLRHALHQQRRLASVDPLTRALNRRAFQIAAERERLRAARNGSPLSVAYLDLDDFKGFNDRYGFLKGDDVIKFTARTLLQANQEVSEGRDFVGHVGGDDFVVVTVPDRMWPLSERIIDLFDTGIRDFYVPEDLERGCIETKDRQNNPVRYPIMGIAIAPSTRGCTSLGPGPIKYLAVGLSSWKSDIVSSSFQTLAVYEGSSVLQREYPV